MSEKEKVAAFKFVDFAAHYQKGFRNNVIPVSEVSDAVQKYRKFECYASALIYNEEIKDYMRKNLHHGRPSVAGYPGVVWGYYIPFDIDLRAGRQDEGFKTAKALAGFLIKYLELDRESLVAYYSGSGIHFSLSSEKFSAEPSSGLHMVFSDLRRRLVKLSMIKQVESIDLTIGDKNRLWRLPGTMNKKTGLFKTELELEELDRLGLEEIKELSKQSKPTRYTDSAGLIPNSKITSNPVAEALYGEAVERLKKRSKTRVQPHQVRKEASDAIETLCEARKKIWDTPVPEGQRNNAGIRLASWFRICGNSKEETESLLKLWNEKNGIGLEDEELVRIVSSAYAAAEPYGYFCFDEIIRQYCPYYPRNHSSCQQYQIFKGVQTPLEC
ncbi:MAG: primase alpha helix C-terminal domain-containing protein [candidate division Zixibacteria bacterium]|nr:primase alpha helix C-terminal domain-containing protein [candidate division Zixibacteria bacterium]